MWNCSSLDYVQNSVYSKLTIKTQEWCQLIPKGNLKEIMRIKLMRLFWSDAAVSLKKRGINFTDGNF